VHRRSFLQTLLCVGELGVTGFPLISEAARALPAPNRPGSMQSHITVPRHATDCHHHIYDSRFPADPKAALRPGNATVADYRRLQKRLGTTRNVIVQPSTYGVDNRCLLDALRQFGGEDSRGIAVVNTSVSDAELKRLQAAGVRGIRFNLSQAGATTPEMAEPLAKRIAPFGWHVQVNASSEQILSLANLWSRLPVPIVFDHFGHVADLNNRAFSLLCKLMQRGKAWTKISGAETISKVGAPTYADIIPLASAFIKESPERLLWGTNWPHPTSSDNPDDVALLNLLAQWTDSESVRTKILVHNPERLYGFSVS
jgi:D-galactarolactone isomerase